MAVRSCDIKLALSKRHKDDYFLTEVKDGPTMGASHARIDAWAMKKSWSKPLVWGYEIKVSRSDFLNDTKWPAYWGYSIRHDYLE
jgi:hypothetical protein